MALKAVVRTIVCSASMFYATVASGQSIAIDWDQSAGYSTEDVSAVQTKLRASGDVTPEVRFNITGVWGKQSEESDAFAAASVIVGMSYIDTQSDLSRAEPELALNIDAGADAGPALAPEQEHPSAQGSARFGGIDVRWMRGGVQLRGEFVTGDPFDGART